MANENQSYPGYLTEKIFDAIHLGTLPLYHGDPLVGDWFDKRAFIDCSGRNAQQIAEIVRDCAVCPPVGIFRKNSATPGSHRLFGRD